MNEFAPQLEYVKQHCEAQRYSEALAIVEMLAAAHPNNPDLLYWRARCLFGLGKSAEAGHLCRQLAVVYGDPRGMDLAGQFKGAAKSRQTETDAISVAKGQIHRRLILRPTAVIALVVLSFTGLGGAYWTVQSRVAWKTIFNGKDFSGWIGVETPNGEIQWAVEGGCMVTPTGSEHSHIRTQEEWKDFEIDLDYRLSSGGNGGVYLRGRVEVQMMDPAIPVSDAIKGNSTVQGQYFPRVQAARPVGEWNRFRARFIGNTLSVWTNGELIHDKVRVTQPTGVSHLEGAVADTGPVMLQAWTPTVWYRNIRIRSL